MSALGAPGVLLTAVDNAIISSLLRREGMPCGETHRERVGPKISTANKLQRFGLRLAAFNYPISATYINNKR